MTDRRFQFLSLAGAALVAFSGCKRPEIRSAPLSIQELAAAVGVSSLCAETHFTSPHYARLVAITTDATGKQRKEIPVASVAERFRVCVLLFTDPKSGALQRLTYAIDSANGGGGGQGYVQIESGSTFQGTQTQNSNGFLYDLTLQKGSETTNIRIELETSASPFPTDSPRNR